MSKTLTDEQIRKIAEKHFWGGHLTTVDDLEKAIRAALLATQQPAPRECRHCGWMCIPNSTPSKTVYPLAQQEPRAMLTVDESNLLARINDATKPVDVADRHAVIKLVERLAVFALMPEIPCE
ncbi:hypothetical protein KTE49_20555 [Burkholderia multivorans]|uniref:hypothetical protein n=1 Tax=Burkholderia multivorans TaxID=87883 RepID=UPI001C26D6C4|nr:hypothetical protein [Burkholderia multivorans]MBU9532829.1 hypothetical protein [Burkholderia multivorans]